MPLVALLQLDTTSSSETTSEGIAAKLDSRTQHVEQAVAALPEDLDLILLPELWTIGAFNASEFVASSQTLDGPHVARMSDLARDKGVWLHAGSFVERAGEEFFNTSLLFDDAGKLVATYRKIHLFGFDSGEARILGAGSQAPVVETPLGRAGLSTCYDMRFPELYRAERQQGAEMFLVPTGWPQARIRVWRALAMARAMENQAWVLGCNGVGVNGSVTMGGDSLVIDPDGQVLSEASFEDEEMLTAPVEPQAARDLRKSFPVHADRRFTVEL